MEKVTGSHLFRIADYSLAKGMMGVGKPIRSATFNVAGFNWTLACFLDGQDEHCAGWMSLVLRLETDAVPVRALLKLSLLDPQRSCPFTRTIIDVFAKQHSGRGIGKFIRRADFETSQFLRDDCFAVHCAVTVVKSPLLEVPGTDTVAPPPPSDLHQHLANLLASGEGADVTFDVGGQTFAAHRWLLAARSPVFRAELFGEMRETRMKQIKLEDMEAAVFRALLHFIYSDTLPSYMEEPMTTDSSSNSMAQHLLVAADRYGLERLRLVCEYKLCRNIRVNTVANTLALAEQHRCGRLKAACLNFIASPGTLAAVIETDGFEHLRLSCPLVIKDLLEKLAKVTGNMRYHATSEYRTRCISWNVLKLIDFP